MNDLWDYTSPEQGDNAYHQWTDAELLSAYATGDESAGDHLEDRGIHLPSSRATRFEEVA